LSQKIKTLLVWTLAVAICLALYHLQATSSATPELA
jgi:hypothetical protein